jgi:signal transduction histidine kinase/ActR/RegA family two-component response regulator
LGDRSLSELLTSPPKGIWHEVHADSRIFEVIARPIPVGARPERWVLVIQDVTQEREIRDQLQQQERLAAVGQLAAGIAHDFNNIMGVIVLHAQMAMTGDALSSKNKERLKTINEQARHAAQLIEQILDFSRRGTMERRPLDLFPLVKEQVRLLRRTLPEHIAVEFGSGTDNHGYLVDADPTRVQQVMMNLAVNARDAMPQGGDLRLELDRLHLDLHQTPPVPRMAPGDWVTLSVADTGTGIAAEVLPHIFDPFYSTKAPGQGSGLGLAQVHGIVAQHQGHIDVQTVVGEGSVFTVYFPTSAASHSAVEETEKGQFPRGEGQVILVVEDNAVLRDAICETLITSGYRVREAPNGREALALLESEGAAVDVVLSDVVMPQMGGLALARAMRDRGWAHPVILMSGHPKQRNLGDLQAEGIVDWLTKPPNLDNLARVIAAALRARDPS